MQSPTLHAYTLYAKSRGGGFFSWQIFLQWMFKSTQDILSFSVICNHFCYKLCKIVLSRPVTCGRGYQMDPPPVENSTQGSSWLRTLSDLTPCYCYASKYLTLFKASQCDFTLDNNHPHDGVQIHKFEYSCYCEFCSNGKATLPVWQPI